MNSCYDNVGKETDMDESAAAAMAAAPSGTSRSTSGDGLIQGAGPTAFENSDYQAAPHDRDNAKAPKSSRSDRLEDNTAHDRHLQEPSPSSADVSRGQVRAASVARAAAPSSLDALALACAQYERDGAATMDLSTGTSTLVASNMTNEGSVVVSPKEEAATVAVADSCPTGNIAATFGSAAGNGCSEVFEVSTNDVLCGRGGLTNHHPGNVFFRSMVRMKQESYLRASKRDKAGVARDIVETIRRLDPPGRFLKKDPSNVGQWVEIGNRKAREKTSQALREGAPELREELTGTTNNSAPGTQSKQVVKQQTQKGRQVPAPRGVFTTAPITAAEREQALRATIDSIPRGRVVSSDSVNGSGWTNEVDLAQYQGAYDTSNGVFRQPHMIVDETNAAAAAAASIVATATVTPLTLTPSASSSSEEPMDTASSGTMTPPPLHPGTNCGTKRKHNQESCSWHHDEMQQDSPGSSSTSSSSSKRGPRMKLLKARMMDFCR